MGCFEFVFLFVSTIVLLILQYDSRTVSAQSYGDDYHFCLGGNYTANSTYQYNVNLLLSSLRNSFSRNKVIKNVYYNNTIGQNPDTVYGSFRCIGDFTSDVCKVCIDTVSQMITTNSRCSKSKQGMIWYNGCMLRYSNEYYFSIMQEKPAVTFWEDGNFSGTDADQFSQILNPLMNDLATHAVSDNTLFATGEQPFKREKKIYGLVQCGYDLSNSSCSTCLQGSISEIPSGKEGGIILRPSCNIRFAVYPFFQSTGTATPDTDAKGKNSTKVALSIVIPSVIAILLTISIWYICLRRKKAMKHIDDVVDIQSAESLQFYFSTIRAATNYFSFANKLGEGGFGTVYKGTLSDGQEIAVKRLSTKSGQGDEEFKNEVVLVVKLQHRNLVRLLGFSLHGEERLLIYEFMPNASLDQFLFDPLKRSCLDWERRYTIIGGIARGLLYLHEDSRLRIVHRDLKASNVLLGADMNPKISDFGMARMFMMNQTQANTNRIVGTYGYMAPEYAMHGHFSVKSDVFSFGVLVLEILSGRKNNSFYGSEGAQDLLSHVSMNLFMSNFTLLLWQIRYEFSTAQPYGNEKLLQAWQHWKEGTTIEFLDSTLEEHHSRVEVMRCIHIGLLCVQEDIANRPSMASIVNMLNNNSVNLKTPSSPPAFFVNSRKDRSIPSASGESESLTVDEASITELHPR